MIRHIISASMRRLAFVPSCSHFQDGTPAHLLKKVVHSDWFEWKLRPLYGVVLRIIIIPKICRKGRHASLDDSHRPLLEGATETAQRIRLKLRGPRRCHMPLLRVARYGLSAPHFFPVQFSVQYYVASFTLVGKISLAAKKLLAAYKISSLSFRDAPRSEHEHVVRSSSRPLL